jgi:hypothetical protein
MRELSGRKTMLLFFTPAYHSSSPNTPPPCTRNCYGYTLPNETWLDHERSPSGIYEHGNINILRDVLSISSNCRRWMMRCVFHGTGVLMMTSIGIVSNTMRRNNKTSLMWLCLEGSLSYLGGGGRDKGRREIEKIVGTCAVSFLVRSINKSVATKARSYPTLLAIAIAARERGGIYI